MQNSSFDARNASFASSQDTSSQLTYANSQQPILSSYRSFSDANGAAHHAASPQIYTAVYSGVSVYEMEVNGVAVMRRRADSWLNATQILKVAGVDKGKRTKVLEREILTGEHEKVQGGYGKYQGTWINYRRGREFCRQYGVEEILCPLLDYDVSSDGTGQPGHGVDTPTKEQAMAANRKRLYTQTQDGRQSQGAVGGGTFFSNLSQTASTAISAMNKAARLSTPTPRPPNAHPASLRRGGSNMSKSFPNSQESFSGSQHVPGMPTDRSFNTVNSSFYTQPGADQAPLDNQEPPRKRMREGSPNVSFSLNGNGDVHDGSPIELNNSFSMISAVHHLTASQPENHAALPPLPHPADKEAEEKQSLLLNLFADLHRTDYSNHPALKNLSGKDLDLPLDPSANTALHWAATLARVSLVRLLIQKGANIFRGNIAGETPLMVAVQVNNCLDHGCFPDLLEALSPLIETRDAKARTILHKIALASGIKGRAASSKYYLEALLEFLVRQTTTLPNSSSSFDANSGLPRPLGLMRFMSEMVNARDMSGNTALNLVARIGNRSIIRQLMEVQADPTIPNHAGLCPTDFGVEANNPEFAVASQASAVPGSPGKAKTPSKREEAKRALLPLLESGVEEIEMMHSNAMMALQQRIDAANYQIQQHSTRQAFLLKEIDRMQTNLRERQARKRKIQNLERAVAEMTARVNNGNPNGPANGPLLKIGDADREYEITPETGIPPPEVIEARLAAYRSLNANLAAHLTSLKSRDSELEGKYRKVVALCTGVPEADVDRLLPQLSAAVESEVDDDVGRVGDFLRKLESWQAVTGGNNGA